MTVSNEFDKLVFGDNDGEITIASEGDFLFPTK